MIRRTSPFAFYTLLFLALWDLMGPPADESAGYRGNAPSGLGFSPERALPRSPDIHVRAVAGDLNPLNS